MNSLELDFANEVIHGINKKDHYLKNLLNVLRDEKSVAKKFRTDGLYNIWYWPGFRMMSSKDHSCLLIALDKKSWVAISIGEDVKMYYHGKNDVYHTYGFPFVNSGTKPLVYFVLFMYTLHNEGFPTLDYLLYRQKTKPFTTHHVFSPTARHGFRYPTQENTLKMCCRMYADILDESGDFILSTETHGSKAWNVRKYEDVVHFDCMQHLAKLDYKECIRPMFDGPLVELIEELKVPSFRFVNEGYFIFEDALYKNRLDIAVWAWTRYNLDANILRYLNVSDGKQNDVVDFLKSL